MTFKTWLLDYVSDNNYLGDFARDATSDENFPNKSNKKVIFGYLVDRRASHEAIETFYELFDRYQWAKKYGHEVPYEQ